MTKRRTECAAFFVDILYFRCIIRACVMRHATRKGSFMIKLCMGAAAAALCATGVLAEERQSNFDGFTFGLLAARTAASTTYEMEGYGYVYSQPFALSISPPRPPWSYTFEQSQSASGTLGGISLGYNWDVGQPQGWVIGAELDHFAGGVSSSNAAMRKYVADIGQRSFSVSDLTTARLRVGYDFSGFMPYAALGVGCGDVSISSVQWMAKPYHQSGTECGESYGIGAEWKAGENVSLRLEHRVTDLGVADVDQTIFGVHWHFN